MSIEDILRLFVPRRLVSAIRLLEVFQHGHGHVRQIDGFAVNGRGKHQPWLTYPLIEFLDRLDFSGKKVFEFGAGSSTLYWAEKAESVTSVEMDEKWYDSLKARLPANVRLIHEPDGGRYPRRIHEFGKFDVIVIDGAERYMSAVAAREALLPGGFIILDNAEWYPNTSDYLSSSGLIEMPFCGFSPLNAFTSISTVFVTPEFSIPKNNEARKPPVGGRSLPSLALDDRYTG